MNLFYRTITLFLFMGSLAFAQMSPSYKVTLNYKAYWAGFTVAEISSETKITPRDYEITANYQVKGLASLFSKSANSTHARGIVNDNGLFRPQYYQSKGNFGSLNYLNQVKFNPETLQVIEHIQDLELRENTVYVPIKLHQKYGYDPLTIFLNMINNKKFSSDYKTLYTERQFGGIFVSEQSFICKETNDLDVEDRSVFSGFTHKCAIDGRRIAGNIKSTKPRKKRKRSRVDDDQDNFIWFGKMPGLDATIPVYTEFPVGWGKVRIYLSDFNIEPIAKNFLTAKSDTPQAKSSAK